VNGELCFGRLNSLITDAGGEVGVSTPVSLVCGGVSDDSDAGVKDGEDIRGVVIVCGKLMLSLS
jgi:hypothetical protein